MTSEPQKTLSETIFAGGGEMGALMRTLRELGAQTAHAKTVEEACQISADVLANNLKDIPFALIYLLDSDRKQANLVSTTNLEIGTPISPRAIELADKASDCWLFNSVLATGENRVLNGLIDRFGRLPGGAWDESPNSAIVLPLTRPGQETLGILIAGISPYRPLDDDYRGFFDLVGGQVTTAIANTLAYEEERKRAEALAELDRAKTTFFNNISHEFRTPLTLMLGLAEDALADRDNPLSLAQQKRIEVIQSNGLRLLKLVNTLLDFSRIESDRTFDTHLHSSSVRILIVDDNADMRDYLKRLLSDCWQVEIAANGAIALAKIHNDPPDLVLSDVMMPEMDGFQLLQALRDDPQTKSIPIILLSARAGEEATIEGLEAGADDYLIKPFSARELMARVNTQLQMSRLRLLQSANRFKNEFLLTVTHELQAPLAAILVWVRLLQTQSFDRAKTARALATIERNATIEAKLVKDLLDTSSILAGKLCLKHQFVDLVVLVQNVVKTFREVADTKSILLIEITSNLAVGNILADGNRLRQIISYLLENAIKFTPQGGEVKIELSSINVDLPLIAEDRMTNYIQIVVTDTGIGIRPDFLPFVFDRFTQAEVPSRHSPGGVGIGLAIARLLVELHGGTIDAASEGEARGAKFTVRLPLNDEPNLDTPT